MSEAQDAQAIKTANSADPSPQTKKKWKEGRFEQNKQTLQLLCDKYPNCFIPYHLRTKEKKQPKPLALGIHHKIQADNPELPIAHIKNALAIYVSGWSYRSIIKEGAVRVDLQGNPTDDKVTEDEDTQAKTHLARKIARKKAIQENQPPRDANKKKREKKETTKQSSQLKSKNQTDSPSKTADKNNASQKITAIKLVHALQGRATLSLKKKEKTTEKETA